MNKCMKTWKLMQKEGYNGLTSLERGKPCKKTGGKRKKKNLMMSLVQIGEREKSLKNF